MLADRGFSIPLAIDLIAGAIDVWLHPAATMAAAAAAASRHEEGTMLSRIARLDCAATLSPDVTKADHRKSAWVMIAGTLALTAVWTVVRLWVGENPYLDALSVMPFLISLLFSMRYTYLKNRPASVQTVFIAISSLIALAIMLASGWLAARL
jgi:hypothetical protein